MTVFWSIFIIVLVVIQVVGALWMLQSYTTVAKADAEADTTGHVWDADLREYNKPLPRWWLILFWLTAVFTVVYLAIYPGFGSFGGVTGWTQNSQYDQEVAAAEARYGDIFAAFAGMSLQDMSQDADAVRLGRNLYLNNCATCHGSDARGAKGFPNLTDNDWIYGGTPAAIQLSISNGRIGVMPGLGAALGDQGLDEVVAHVLSLSGREADAGLAQAGATRYAQLCIACHAPDGRGVAAVGGPNLTDDIWLHGSRPEDIRAVIADGKVNQMPAQRDLLTEDRIRTLVAYVLSLSRGN